MAALGDLVAKMVRTEIADLTSNATFAFDLMTKEDNEIRGKGDSFQVGSFSAMTVNSDGSSLSITPEVPTRSALDLIIDNEPAIVQRIDRREDSQAFGSPGAYARNVATQAVPTMRNEMDQNLFDYFHISLTSYDSTASDPDGQYAINAGGATITDALALSAVAKLNGNRGNDISAYRWFVESYMHAKLAELAGFTALVRQPESGPSALGLPMVGMFHGIPVHLTAELPGSSARGRYTVACTVVTIATNVATITATGHGLVAGNLVTVTGTTEELTTAAAITSVTNANVFVVPFTASDATPMADSAGTVTLDDSVNFLVDTRHVHVAESDNMMVRFADHTASTGKNLIVSPLYGRVGRRNRVISFYSPFESFTG